MLTRTIAPSLQTAAAPCKDARDLYFKLLHEADKENSRASAAEFLQRQIAACADAPSSIPETIEQLEDWIVHSSQAAGAEYQQYLNHRKQGAPRRYFSSKAHALYFLNRVAPTKMVDGSWLYGMVKHWEDPAFSELIDIYLEELGDGIEEQNHVAIYRKLLRTHGCERWQHLPPDYFTQGAIQLALATVADQYQPEVIGFNLAYEQLPLHLLITTTELDELNIDPFYFTLHITIDNALSGHAVKAVNAVRNIMSRYSDQQDFIRRLLNGARLSNQGLGTVQIINAFKLEEEVVRIFQEKAILGQHMHNNHCRIGGRNLQEWLSAPHQIPALLQALQDGGWIVRNQDPKTSRFWKLIDGSQGQMFGVFTPYEKQVVYDWIASDALEQLPRRERLGESWRVQKRQTIQQSLTPSPASNVIQLGRPEDKAQSQEQRLFHQQLDSINDKQARMRLLEAWMTPAMHDSPAGLAATRRFKAELVR
ncbi:iron-containing redox enzyme family protein [Methylobacillus arboreus]|uniref:iron-containing redox enzyme family protein n=1 Tax=Methylobacillus arboreus TaxID=755170 RepID=UPI001E59EFD4|nr:iron-containing redox enzyme family protein [Methylobacillus arboreus]MCB5191858.1 iron-containing redox enzyme family protein [Methylobacillus arboreus]